MPMVHTYWFVVQNAFEHHCGCCCRLSVVQTRYIVVPTATHVTPQEVALGLYTPCHGLQWLWAVWSESCLVMLCVLAVRTNVLMDKPAVYWTQDYMAAALILGYCMIFPFSCRSTYWFVGVLTRVVNITDYESVLLRCW